MKSRSFPSSDGMIVGFGAVFLMMLIGFALGFWILIGMERLIDLDVWLLTTLVGSIVVYLFRKQLPLLLEKYVLFLLGGGVVE